MGAGEIITARIQTDGPAITPLIAAPPYPMISTQADSGIYPKILYEVPTRNDLANFDGQSNLQSRPCNIFCLSTDPTELSTIADAVRTLFDAKSGTWGGKVVQGSFVEDEGDLPPATDESTGEQQLVYIYHFQILLVFVP